MDYDLLNEIAKQGSEVEINLPKTDKPIILREPVTFKGKAISVRSPVQRLVSFDFPPRPDGIPHPWGWANIGVESEAFENVWLTKRSTCAPLLTGFFRARAKPLDPNAVYARSVGKSIFTHFKCDAQALKASVCFIGMECSVHILTEVSNNYKSTNPLDMAGSPGFGLFISDGNELEIPELDGNTFAWGPQATNANHEFINCNAGHYGSGVAIAIGSGTHNLRWRGGSCPSKQPMKAMLAILGIGNWNIFIDKPEWECGLAECGILVKTALVKHLELEGGFVQCPTTMCLDTAKVYGKCLLPEPGIVRLTNGSVWNGPCNGAIYS